MTEEREASGANPGSPAEVERLERGIRETRAGMSQTVSELEHRLSPTDIAEKVGGELKRVVQAELQEAKGLLRDELNEAEQKVKRGLGEARAAVKQDVREAIGGAKAALRAATVGQVEGLATTIGDKMNRTRDTLMDTVRSNPVPAALAGVGIVWLLMNRSRSASRAAGAVGEGASTLKDAAGRGLHQVADAVGSAAHGASERTQELGHRAGEAATHLAHQASDAAVSAAHSAKRGARYVEEGVRSNLHENPLAVGAAAVAIGAVIGYALPRTAPEDALMGDARDRVLHLAGDAAQGGADSVAKLAETALEGPKSAPERSEEGRDFSI